MKYHLAKLAKFRPEWFGAYGLDANKNFLQAPVCECGCGEKAILLLEDIEELFGFMFEMLMAYDCERCAIFAHTFNGEKYVAIKSENNTDDPVLFFQTDEDYINFFEDWADELDLCCYGLITEVKPGEWKIIEN